MERIPARIASRATDRDDRCGARTGEILYALQGRHELLAISEHAQFVLPEIWGQWFQGRGAQAVGERARDVFQLRQLMHRLAHRDHTATHVQVTSRVTSDPMVSLTTRVADDLEDVRPYLSDWDQLAVACAKPYCAPAWLTSWWLHAAPQKALLRLVLVFEGKELVGVAPLFVDSALPRVRRLRVLGARCSSRVDLLARPGMEADVGAAFASALSSSQPRPDVVMFEGVPGGSGWPGLLAEAWPGPRPACRQQFTQPAPSLRLEGGSYDEWFASKSRNFRQSMRRRRRRLDGEGATVRLATEEDLEPGLRYFSALHHGRWAWRGGSRVLNPGVERMLVAAGRRLVHERRFRLVSIEIGGRTISSHIFLSAGGETSYWLGGFDQAWAAVQPSLVTILAAIEGAFASGDRRFDLGTGGQDYKYRLSDGADTIEWTLMVPHGPQSVLAATQLLPERARIAAAGRLSPRTKRAINAARDRLGGARRRPVAKRSGQ
jgi:CelD/BcsL family acetyltransferase involved in cellulose biosynthesis